MADGTDSTPARAICLTAFFCLATSILSLGQTLQTLTSFTNRNGAIPVAPLVQGLDGAFYGTTAEGGMNSSICDGAGCGTLFRISSQGALKTLHSFCSQPDCADGFSPQAGLLQTYNGDLYGTTAESGSAYLTGTAFVVSPGGALTTLQNFLGVQAAFPSALIQASATDFYGTAGYYGTPNGAGAIYEVSSDGVLTTVYQFTGTTDGGHPLAPLLEAGDGIFYGTTSGECGGCGNGTIFRISASGALTTLHTFKGSDGANPQAGLVLGPNDSLYGTTINGGMSTNCRGGCGTVFQITASGTLVTLHSFDGNDGAHPYGGLVLGTDGNFYGTTANYLQVGGGSGTIFTIARDRTFANLHTFTGTDGQFPSAGLTQGTDGDFYGTTSRGGTYGYGTVFKFSMGLGAFVTTLPIAAKVGADVRILGTDVTGATSVTFDAIEAAFRVLSGTDIVATVPSGAESGIIRVTTPSGTLRSNILFHVLP